MGKKLTKEIEGTVVKITEGKTSETREYDFAKLPKEIQAKLGPFGLGHKEGDSAAGKEGAEALDAMDKVFAGLMAGDWSVKAPAGEKVSVKALKDLYEGTKGKDQILARSLLEKLNVQFGPEGQFLGIPKKEEAPPKEKAK
jgi:hypothetical protein